MADRRLVLDANILVRAALGMRVRGLIERYAGPVDLLIPEYAIAEVQEHLPTILAKRRLPLEPVVEILDRLRAFLQELPESFYAAQKDSAQARLSGVDAEDWPVLALCPGVRMFDLDRRSGFLRYWRGDLDERSRGNLSA